MQKKQFQNTVLLLLLVVTSSISAQQVYIGMGLGSASFNEYENSAGENTLSNTDYNNSEEPFFEGGLKLKLTKRLKLDLGIQYYKYKINTAFNAGNTRVPKTYKLSYVGFKTGFTFDILQWNKLTFQTHLHVSRDLLLSGTNRYQNVFVDLHKEKTLDRGLWNFHAGMGAAYKISDDLSAYLNYTRRKSLKEQNQDSTDGEAYSLAANTMTIGLIFTIPRYFRLWKG